MNAQLWRLLLICTAWSLGVVLLYLTGTFGLYPVLPAIFAAAAYVLTRDVSDAGRGGGGGAKYWRGRRVDEPRWKRWN